METLVQPMERKAWLDAFYAGGWDVFSDDLVGDFAGPETFLAYMRPSAEPGYNWVTPQYDAAMDVAAKLADRPARYEALAKAEKILLSLLFCGGNVALFSAIVFTLWLTPAVIVRAQAQSLSKREFIEAAQAGGITPWSIVTLHIVPNRASVVIVYGALLVPEVILSQSFLSFLGIGIKEPQASWGTLIETGTAAMDTDLRLLLLPGCLLAAVLFCLNFIADGLRDAFDPNGR